MNNSQSSLTTLCYIEKDNQYLMLHRVSKKKDVNKGKWIGVGGHFEAGESPEECLVREVREETGLTLTSWQFRGILTFSSEGWPDEYICVYTADYPCVPAGSSTEPGNGVPAESSTEPGNGVPAESSTEPGNGVPAGSGTVSGNGVSAESSIVPGNGVSAGSNADEFPVVCTEGHLAWIPKDEILSLNLWEGDRIFLKLLLADAPFFSLKLSYRGDSLTYAALDGRKLELP